MVVTNVSFSRIQTLLADWIQTEHSLHFYYESLFLVLGKHKKRLCPSTKLLAWCPNTEHYHTTTIHPSLSSQRFVDVTSSPEESSGRLGQACALPPIQVWATVG